MKPTRPANSSRSLFAAGCAATILLGAFLLFQVQPMLSKRILPWFGGSPAVWTTCVLFFQTALLAGYAYADAVARFVAARFQPWLHAGLLLAAAAMLPITPSDAWKPPDGEFPAWRILLLLTAVAGLPFASLSATSPLVQAWFARVCPDRSPYRLYALSNIGSLGALLTYPFFVEPLLSVTAQGTVWSALFVAFAVLCCGLAFATARAELPASAERKSVATAAATTDVSESLPTWQSLAAWFLLPAYASVMLLAVTNHLCQYVAVVPFLWIAPLSLYLISFVICFDRPRWYGRVAWSSLTSLALLLCSYYLLAKYVDRFCEEQLEWAPDLARKFDHVEVHLAVYLPILFGLCMISHGELVRLRPPPRWLTLFYLLIAAGGAAGGALVAVVCPLMFSTHAELNLGMMAGFALAVTVLLLATRPRWKAFRLLPRAYGVVFLAIMTGTVGWSQWDSWDHKDALLYARNFYGVLIVRERHPNDPDQRGLAMYNGGILHGFQFAAAEKRQTPTTYYLSHAGVGLAIKYSRRLQPLRVGVVGLGTGTLAAHGFSGDHFRFYEINPLVIDAAQQHFTFLQGLEDRGGTWEIVPGDARLSLEREPPQQFDVLVLDAFSGDAIPSHLLTVEAMEVYLRHMKPHGVIAIHTSNRYLDLVPVVVELSRYEELEVASVTTMDFGGDGLAPSEWMLVSRDRTVLDAPGIRDVAKIPGRYDRAPLWTDQFNSLFEIVR